MPTTDDSPAFRIRPTDLEAAGRLTREVGVHPVTAAVLVARGVATAEAARRFLSPGPDDLHDPWLFRDMRAAVDRVAEAFGAGARIAVYGDYDVDGVSATAVLVRALRSFGADVVPFIPHRVHDGYGLNEDALDQLRAEGIALVVTVDNGSTRAGAIARAEARGLRVVVTDHHEVGAEVPPCPLVNPKRPDSTYPFAGLAGCGVSLKLALAVADRLGRTRDPGFRALLPDLLALVAIGTVADVMPLVDENRSLVAAGLRALQGTRHAGLRALLDVARCGDRRLRAADIAFRIGPRVNAAGRLGSARLALDLMLAEDPAEAARLAADLDADNRERQRIERLQADEAFAQAQRRLADDDAPALVLAQEGWHPGVIGIVAARVTETFGRPAVLITVENGRARGSARCFHGTRLHEALARCAPLLETHGGHAKAAGFTLRADRVDAFRAAFCEAVRAQGARPPAACEVDAELPLDAITPPLAAEIEALQPFGLGNEEPVFCARGVRVAGRPRRVGPNDAHLLFYAASDRTSVRAVAFHQGAEAARFRGRLDLAFVLRRREGPEPYEIHVQEAVPSRS